MVVRLRTRRRQFSWIRIAAVAALALLGGAAVWSGLSTSEAHAARQKQRGGSAQEQQLGGQAAAEDGSGGKADTHANLNAWTQLTTVGGDGGSSSSAGSGSSGSGSADSGSSSGEGGAGGGAAQQQQQQQQEKQDTQAAVQREGGGAAGGGSQQGGSGLGAASGYVTVELKVPQAPPSFNSWVHSEDMLLFHLRALQQQLEQVYVGMALAAAAGRAFVLPQLQCFCQNAAQPLPRCRRPDSTQLQFPEACPEGDVLMPLPDFTSGGEVEGMPLHVEPHAASQSITSDQMLLRPSAAILWPKCASTPPDPSAPDNSRVCLKEGREGGSAVLSVPPSLIDTHLLPLLEPYQKHKLWRLDFSDVGSPWHAFAGWECAEPAKKFDQRLSRAVKPWPAPNGSGLQQLGMTAGRTYSAIPRLKDCPPGTNAAAGGGAAATGGQAVAARRF